jgi:soluble lytic murein transglycosylase
MKVPTYDNFQSQEAGQPNAQLQAPSGPTPGAIAADQSNQLGQALTKTGTDFSRIALDVADQANQVRVNDAVNQARMAAQDLAYNKDTGYLTKKGSQAFLDEQGKPLDAPLTQTYGEKLQSTLSEISGNLGNDQQRRAFQMHAGDMAAQFHGQVESHMLQQFGSYKDATDDATAKLAGQNAALNWNQPDVVRGAIDEGKAAVAAKAQRAGLTGAPLTEALLAGTSAIHENVIMAALQNNNPKYAMDYLTQAREKGEMTGQDILKVYGHITQADAQQQAQAVVSQQSVAAMPVLAPTSFDRMTQITLGSESNGQRYGPDGKTLLTSPKGAKGEMQVLDSTNKDPGYGVTPAKDDSPNERARVGRDYLQALMQKYGDPAKAWAAYNAGPGALDKAIVNAGARPNGDWLTFLPQETQAYVSKNMAALGSAAPVAPRPTELEFVNGALARLGSNATPQAVHATREAAVAQFGIINKSLNEQGTNAYSAAQRWLATNPEATVNQMPPKLMDDMVRYAPGNVDDLHLFSSRIKRSDTPTNMAAFNAAVTYPEELAKMTDPVFNQFQAANFAKADQEKVAKIRADFINSDTDNSAGAINNKALNTALTNRLENLGITTPKRDDKDGNARVGAIQKFARDSIYAQQAQLGRKLLPAEIDEHIDSLFAKNVTFKNTVLGFETGGTTATSMMSLKWGDIPGDSKDRINKVFAANGQPNATEGDKLRYYWTWKNKNAN